MTSHAHKVSNTNFRSYVCTSCTKGVYLLMWYPGQRQRWLVTPQILYSYLAALYIATYWMTAATSTQLLRQLQCAVKLATLGQAPW